MFVQDLSRTFSNWERYHDLWRVDKETTIKEVLASSPSLSEYDTIIQRFTKQEKDVSLEPSVYRVGAIDISTGR